MTVRAAGGLVWRRSATGDVEVLLVHRPRYDDWTFPKGKAEEGESDEDCALREVCEETGLVCALGEELPSTAYVDRNGREKSVRYWAMTVVDDGAWSPGDEVDGLAWVTPDEARRRLTYTRDLDVLDGFLLATGS